MCVADRDLTPSFPRILFLVDDCNGISYMEESYEMVETFTEAQPATAADDMADVATVSSPDIEKLNQEADAASTALRHAEDEAALASPFWQAQSWWKNWTYRHRSGTSPDTWTTFGSTFKACRTPTRARTSRRLRPRLIRPLGSWCLWPSCWGASTLLGG